MQLLGTGIESEYLGSPHSLKLLNSATVDGSEVETLVQFKSRTRLLTTSRTRVTWNALKSKLYASVKLVVSSLTNSSSSQTLP